jgi:hypothetical protein
MPVSPQATALLENIRFFSLKSLPVFCQTKDEYPGLNTERITNLIHKWANEMNGFQKKK